MMTVYYYTIFRMPEDEKIREKLLNILRDISSKDKSFMWGISRDGKHITIISENEKQAYARGYWIKQKADLPKDYLKKMFFNVVKIESLE